MATSFSSHHNQPRRTGSERTQPALQKARKGVTLGTHKQTQRQRQRNQPMWTGRSLFEILLKFGACLFSQSRILNLAGRILTSTKPKKDSAVVHCIVLFTYSCPEHLPVAPSLEGGIPLSGETQPIMVPGDFWWYLIQRTTAVSELQALVSFLSEHKLLELVEESLVREMNWTHKPSANRCSISIKKVQTWCMYPN
jgi:hypothetical protein